MNSDINKVLSFVLGLIVVVVFIAIITNRFKLGNTFSFLKAKPKTTPTVTVKPTVTPLAKGNNQVTIKYPTTTPVGTKYIATNNGTNGANGTNTTVNGTGNNVNTIPSTGAPTLLLPIAFSALGGGIFLKRKAKKS
jgi:hypothetical protein